MTLLARTCPRVKHPYLCILVVILVVVPGIGSVLGVAGSLYYDWLLFGEEYFDYPLALRGKRRQEKKDFIRRNRDYAMGLGAAVFLANFIPLVGSVLLATAVVGAVLLHRRLESAPGLARDARSHGRSALIGTQSGSLLLFPSLVMATQRLVEVESATQMSHLGA